MNRPLESKVVRAWGSWDTRQASGTPPELALVVVIDGSFCLPHPVSLLPTARVDRSPNGGGEEEKSGSRRGGNETEQG